MAAKVTGSGRSGRRPAGRNGAGQPLHTDDNRSPEEKAAAAEQERKDREAAEAIQLLSIVAAAKTKLAARAITKLADDAAKQSVTDVFTAAKLQSKEFTRERIMELVEDSKPEGRRDVTKNEEIRTRFRRAMGLPVGKSDEQQQLDARLPDVEREGAFWFEAGYTAGLAGGMDRDAPTECVSAGHDNRFNEGWKAGQAVVSMNVAAAMQAKADAKKAKAPPPAEETADQRKTRERAEESKAKEGLTGMARANGDKPAEAPALDPVQAAIKADAPKPAGEFEEMTEDERAAQAARQGIQAAKATDAEVATAKTDAAENEAV